jgi:Xaa-Pro aminopeptidase
MRRAAVLLVLTLCALANRAGGLDEHRQRRAELKKKFPGAVIALAGANEPEKGAIRLGFLQEPNFYYLTGWKEPGAKAKLTPERDILYLPEITKDRLRYTGPKAQAGDAGIEERSGFDEVSPLAKFEEVENPEGLTKAVERMRMVKSAGEVAAIQRAVDASVEAHLAAWRRIKPGLREHQVAATMRYRYLDAGCERDAYEPIVAAGANAVTLHYHGKSGELKRGELVLMDVGAECGSYVADITRTVPVSGRFTARQRELYEAVYGAQRAAIAAAKPGVTFAELNRIAREYLRTHGKSKSGKTLDEYLTHFLGHAVGLEVHDPTDREAPLEEGNVLTIEPGVYIPEEGIGIRIEDMIVVTRTGARVMTAALPSEAGAVERFLAARNTPRR